MCIYKTQDGLCKKHSSGDVVSYCIEGPCPDEVLTNADRRENVDAISMFQHENEWRGKKGE